MFRNSHVTSISSTNDLKARLCCAPGDSCQAIPAAHQQQENEPYFHSNV